jgi:(2Fe-2S) ferredoxin
MPGFVRHVFVCTNQRPAGSPRGCCNPTGDSRLRIALKEALKKRGLKREVRANAAGCLDQCEHGPTIVVYPEGVWYGGVGLSDVDEIVESHLVGGVPVERLRLTDGCVNTEACEHRVRIAAGTTTTNANESERTNGE